MSELKKIEDAWLGLDIKDEDVFNPIMDRLNKNGDIPQPTSMPPDFKMPSDMPVPEPESGPKIDEVD